MSYPYQQGPPHGPPGQYPPPHQHSPYPPGGGAPNPNSYGYNMPQPMPPLGYSSQGSYPSSTQGSDLPPLPPLPSGGSYYPPSSGGSPYHQPPYQGGGNYPPPPGGSHYPPHSGGSYPPPPSSASSYPPPPSGGSSYPPPHSGGSYAPPPSGGSYAPPPSGGSAYPPHQGSSPVPPQGYGQRYRGPSDDSYRPPHSGGPHSGYSSAPQGYGQQSYAEQYSHSYTSSHQPAASPKRTPTVVPAHPFDPAADAEVLRKAMKGFGTDEKAIINILARRTNAQRVQIEAQFKTMYGKDLIKDLKSELSGNFEKLAVSLVRPLPEFYAKQLHDAIEGAGTDEEVLIEILCTKSNSEIQTIKQAYSALYYRPLEEDLRGDTSGTFKRLMVSLCNASRDESMRTNPEAAYQDAQELLSAGELMLGTDESTFNKILCQRNYAQLRLIFDKYEGLTGHDIEEAVKSEFSGDSEEGLLAVIRSIKNQPAFFARMLHHSMKNLGTDDTQLIRVVATRCEVDMGDIKREYQAKYGESLADAIKSDCSGHYKKCLLALIGEYE